MSTPLADAAVQLGISREALRKRIARGSIRAEKRDGRWYVQLPAADAGVDSGQDAASRQQDAPSGQPDARQDVLIARLESEVAYLRSALDAEIEARRRADHLVAGLVERLPALAETVDATVSEIQAPGRDAGPQTTDTTLKQEREPLAPVSDRLALRWRRWWRKMLGG